MSDFYSNPTVNKYNLLTNEYLIIKEAATGDYVDSLRWTGEEHKALRYGNFNSRHFGEIKPIKNDVY